MNTKTHVQSTNQWPFILALILVGLNLRPSMAAIGPLLTHIQATIPASYSFIALLTMLPVLTMGLAMFFGVRFAARFGEYKTIACALAVIGLSNLARLYANDGMNLILTAITAGMGIAIIQSLVPGLIKNHFKQSVPLLMGLYITAIMAGAALAAAIGPFIASVTGNWQLALAIWSALAALAISAWFMIRQKIQPDATQPIPVINKESFVKRPRAWLLGVFFGLCTASYTCVLAWLPPYYVEQGLPETQAGLLLAYLTGMEVVSGLITPLIASYYADRRLIILVLLLLVIGGFTGLLLAPVNYAMVWTGLLGLGIGGLFPLSLIIAMDHLDAPQRAGQLTAFVQGIGYLIAAFSPLIAGYIKDVSSSFDQAWLLLILITIAMIGITWFFNPLNYARQFRS
jgi:CP family cyanate transporter-like MFS transporter